jgi:hypothetical protein
VSWETWLLGGFVATIVLTILIASGYGLGFTRLNIPWLLGSMITPNRERAKVLGFLIHLVNGWLFALVYFAAFAWWGEAGWLLGAAIGAVHAIFVLTAGMSMLPGLHPRMASEGADATVTRGLEPPGFLALHYGPQTPVAVLVSHMVYGAILGAAAAYY